MLGVDTRPPYYVSSTMTIAERLDELRAGARRFAASPLAAPLVALCRQLAGPDPSRAQLAIAALRVAQRAGYHRDNPGEWFQSVHHTVLHGGDCEDLSQLFVALCWLLGLVADLEWIEQPDRPLDHVTAWVDVDGVHRWADASVCGARVGEWTYDAIARLGSWYVVDATLPGGACAVD